MDFDAGVYHQRSGMKKQAEFLSRKRWVSNKHPLIVITNVIECLLDMRHGARGVLYGLSHLIFMNKLIR